MKKIAILITLLININLYAINTKEIYKNSYKLEAIGKYDKAIDVLSPILKSTPNDYTINLRVGYLFSMSGHYNSSIKYYKNASMIAPSAINPKLAMANINLILENYSNAEMIAFEILKMDYYNFYGNLYAIKALKSEKKYDIALKLTNKMLELYPTNILFLQELALIYEATESKDLKKIYNKISLLDPNNYLLKK
jgi:tetratricopeptide (TPR) repeat protein